MHLIDLEHHIDGLMQVIVGLPGSAGDERHVGKDPVAVGAIHSPEDVLRGDPFIQVLEDAVGAGFPPEIQFETSRFLHKRDGLFGQGAQVVETAEGGPAQIFQA